MNRQAYRDPRGADHHERQRFAAVLVAVFGCLLIATSGVAQTGKLSDEKGGEIQVKVSQYMATSKAPGVSVAIVLNGEFVWAAGFGMADRSLIAGSHPQGRGENSLVPIGPDPVRMNSRQAFE